MLTNIQKALITEVCGAGILSLFLMIAGKSGNSVIFVPI